MSKKYVQISPADGWECQFTSPLPDRHGHSRTYVPLVGWGLTDTGDVEPLVIAPDGSKAHHPADEIPDGDPCTYRLIHPKYESDGGIARPGHRLPALCGECSDRWIWTEDAGEPDPCPRCHPKVVGYW